MDFNYEQIDEISCTPMSCEPTNEFLEFIQVHQRIMDKEVHSNSKRILLIIYGNYKESCENFWFCLFISSFFYGVAIKTFDLVYLFHFVYEAAIKTQWLCCFVVLSLRTSQLLCCVKFKYHL